MNLLSQSEAALSTLLGYSECVRQLPNISKCLPHRQASEDTLLHSVERISERKKEDKKHALYVKYDIITSFSWLNIFMRKVDCSV